MPRRARRRETIRPDDCVEVAQGTQAVHVRDSKDLRGSELARSPTAWNHFVSYAAQNCPSPFPVPDPSGTGQGRSPSSTARKSARAPRASSSLVRPCRRERCSSRWLGALLLVVGEEMFVVLLGLAGAVGVPVTCDLALAGVEFK
ncbi:DUF397 domain-containing protein [Streptomyces sp. NPDC001780]